MRAHTPTHRLPPCSLSPAFPSHCSIGAAMYYPVAVEGGLLSMGDAHLAQVLTRFNTMVE